MVMVTRMDEVHSPKQALHWEVAGFRRRPGRPRMNWRDVKKDLQRMGLTWKEVETSAQDRHSWRQRVALCIGDAGRIGQINCVFLFKAQADNCCLTSDVNPRRLLSFDTRMHLIRLVPTSASKLSAYEDHLWNNLLLDLKQSGL